MQKNIFTTADGLLKILPKVKVCDARGGEKRTAAGNQKNSNTFSIRV